jgi:hypothetical protein
MNAIAEVNHNTAVAVPGFDPFAAYGQQAASGGGNYLKFSKGEFLLGQEDKEIKLGTRLVANMDEMSIGWIHWQDGKPSERRMGLLSQGYKPETRAELGYNDQALWEIDTASVKPKDPWNFTNEIPMANPESGEQMTFSASSKGGIGAVGNLCKAYGKEYRARPGCVPVVELNRDSYKHTEYGKTYVPVLSVVDWRDAMPDAPAVEEEVETKAAPEKAAKSGATRF